MGDASLAGHTFRLDPTSVRWEFNTKVADFPTVGGKVVQVYGTSVSDMTVTGTFGKGGWREQAAFLKTMKKVGSQQVAEAGISRSHRNPHRFLYPSRGWDFLVYLKAFSNPEGSRSVVLDNNIVAPKWTLTLFIVEDNTGLKKVAQDAYIARLAKGIGWKKTKYNGPLGSDELKANLAGKSVEDFLTAEFGMGYVPAGNQDPTMTAGAGASPAPTSSGGTQGMVRDMAAAKGWTGAEWDALFAIVSKESTWNPTAQNPTSTAYGLFQFLNSTWATVGATKTSDPRLQTEAGLRYIEQRYGTPTRAWAFHQANNYY